MSGREVEQAGVSRPTVCSQSLIRLRLCCTPDQHIQSHNRDPATRAPSRANTGNSLRETNKSASAGPVCRCKTGWRRGCAITFANRRPGDATAHFSHAKSQSRAAAKNVSHYYFHFTPCAFFQDGVVLLRADMAAGCGEFPPVNLADDAGPLCFKWNAACPNPQRVACGYLRLETPRVVSHMSSGQPAGGSPLPRAIEARGVGRRTVGQPEGVAKAEISGSVFQFVSISEVLYSSQ